MSHPRSKLAPRFRVRPARPLLLTALALVGAAPVAVVPGCGAPPDPSHAAISRALSAPLGAPPFLDGIYVPINDMPIDSVDGAVVLANGNAALSSFGTAFHDAAVDG